MPNPIATACALLLLAAAPAAAEGLRVTYPYDGHKTQADRIFFVGTAARGGTVTVNGVAVRRSPAGHFAPTVPLKPGPNVVTLRHGGQALSMTITRTPKASERPAPAGLAFAPGSVEPAVDLAVRPGEPVTFAAVAAPGVQVAVKVGGRTIPLAPQPAASELPDNKAGLTDTNRPLAIRTVRYAATVSFQAAGKLGKPVFTVTGQGARRDEAADGALEVLRPDAPAVVEVIEAEGVTRTGPGTDYSRLAPLPRGARATVDGRAGAWLRRGPGVWIAPPQTRPQPRAHPPQSLPAARRRPAAALPVRRCAAVAGPRRVGGR